MLHPKRPSKLLRLEFPHTKNSRKMEGVRRRRGGGNASQQHQQQQQQEDVEDDNGKGHMMDGEAFWGAGMSRGSEDRAEFPLIARPVPMYAYYGTVLWAASATLKWFYDWLPSWQSFSVRALLFNLLVRAKTQVSDETKQQKGSSLGSSAATFCHHCSHATESG